VEIKPKFFGKQAQVVQDRLNQLGLQGWELVAVNQSHHFNPVQLYLKKEMP
jgi:hypothetical protein